MIWCSNKKSISKLLSECQINIYDHKMSADTDMVIQQGWWHRITLSRFCADTIPQASNEVLWKINKIFTSITSSSSTLRVFYIGYWNLPYHSPWHHLQVSQTKTQRMGIAEGIQNWGAMIFLHYLSRLEFPCFYCMDRRRKIRYRWHKTNQTNNSGANWT